MQFEALPYFSYDLPGTWPPLLPRFGLREKSWSDVVSDLEQASDETTSCKLVYLARHGQGVHNLAEEKYGSHEWEAFHAKQTGDGHLVWGPDPCLTQLGERQAADVHDAWKHALTEDDAPPVPAVLCSSPLRRSLQTACLTWGGIDGVPQVLHVYEDLREVCGKNTCDRRSQKSDISMRLPMAVVFEDAFPEEDTMWTPERESNDTMRRRVHRALESIWCGVGRDAKVLSITCHGGVMQRVFEVTNHARMAPAVGAFVPLVIRGTRPPSRSTH